MSPCSRPRAGVPGRRIPPILQPAARARVPVDGLTLNPSGIADSGIVNYCAIAHQSWRDIAERKPLNEASKVRLQYALSALIGFVLAAVIFTPSVLLGTGPFWDAP